MTATSSASNSASYLTSYWAPSSEEKAETFQEHLIPIRPILREELLAESNSEDFRENISPSSSPYSAPRRDAVFGFVDVELLFGNSEKDEVLNSLEDDLDECKEEVEDIFRSLQSTMRRFESLQNDFDKATLMRERLYRELVDDPMLSGCNEGFSNSLTTDVVHPTIQTNNRFQILDSKEKSA